jgi:SAM-dependent methyltransferase
LHEIREHVEQARSGQEKSLALIETINTEITLHSGHLQNLIAVASGLSPQIGWVANDINRSTNIISQMLQDLEARLSGKIDFVTAQIDAATVRSEIVAISQSLQAADNRMSDKTDLISGQIEALAARPDIAALANSIVAADSRISGKIDFVSSQIESATARPDIAALAIKLQDIESRLSDRIDLIAVTVTSASSQHEGAGKSTDILLSHLGNLDTQQATRIAPIANEVNRALNVVLAQQTSQSGIAISVADIRSQLNLMQERVMNINLLSARSISALLQRSLSNTGQPLVITKPEKSLSFEKQIEAFRKLAPNNIDAWIGTYKAGLIEYNKTNEGNLSHEGHMGAGIFRMFINVHGRGRLLDFGCGPLPVPIYLGDWPLNQLAGFDPLEPFEPHPFPFAKTLGENIPWPDQSFETIVIGTSLDHVYLLDKVLDELKRLLAPRGRLLIWTAMMESTAPYDPYGPTIDQPDAFHLFHPGKNWFYDRFAKDYELIERMETVAGAEMLAYQKREN